MLKASWLGLADVVAGLSNWRTSKMLAWNDVRRRYRRSGLGQFWLTLSMAATIGGLGLVYSRLFGVNISTYLPYIAVTFVIWGFISTVVIDSCGALTENEQLLRHVSLPRSLFTYRVIYAILSLPPTTSLSFLSFLFGLGSASTSTLFGSWWD